MEVSLVPGQELLVIERTRPANRDDRYTRPRNDDYPGSGTLMTRWQPAADQPEREVPVPLEHTDVHASISGPISSVNVTQQFHNPYSSKIEAVYVFPLPDDAAVNDFVMTIGSRSIRGVIREREQAQQIYNQARAQGYHASLMSQERANIFTERVANIEPSESVNISITYFGSLAFRDGGYEFVFPMVVGPRYNPASTMTPRVSELGSPQSGTGIGAVPAYAPPSGQATDVSYLRPDMRCGRDISISVNLNAGIPIEAIDSPTHRIDVQATPGAPTAAISLSAADTLPNRDFVLRYRVAGGQVRAGLIATHNDRSSNPDDNFFTMTIVPPADLNYCPRGPVEMVFVIDCSGSMDGVPIELAKRCIRDALPSLRNGDTFQIIKFSDKAEFLTHAPVNANPENITQADRYVAALQAGGGTELLNGLEPALELRGDWKRTRFVCVLSDGLLGNEPEVLGQLKRKLGDSRIFTVSIGSAPNRALMNAMARMGRGCAATVSVPQDADEVMHLFMERVSSAAMSDLRLEFGNLDEKDVYPKKLPDLFVDRPVVITGRFRGQARPGQTIKVSGRIGENRQTIDVPVVWADPTQSRALPLVWARSRITDLDEETSWGRKAGAGSTQGPNHGEIKDLALRYGLMSAYTSFVAVDCAQPTQGSYGTTVAIPSPMPPGTRYETTVPSR
jgi:Ca-activated chloride channel family protein